MNLRLNLWKLLLFLALVSLALAIHNCQPSADSTNNINAIRESDSGIMPKDSANDMFIRYYYRFYQPIQKVEKIYTLKDKAACAFDTTNVPALANVADNPHYFKIKSHELDTIISRWAGRGGEHVYAFLGSGQGAEGQPDTIDLIFASIEPDSLTDNVNWAGAEFYDFSTPCPPLCDEMSSSTDNVASGRISNQVANERNLRYYRGYYKKLAHSTICTNIDAGNCTYDTTTVQKSRNVAAIPHFFKIEKNKLNTIVSSRVGQGGDNVYAFLASKAGNEGQPDTIELIFCNVEPNIDPQSEGWEVAEFYDISNPCPPLFDMADIERPREE